MGTPPTFPEARDYLEAHLVDFEGDLYGKTIVLEFADRLREQRAFDSDDELAAALQHDIENAVAVVGGEQHGCATDA